MVTPEQTAAYFKLEEDVTELFTLLNPTQQEHNDAEDAAVNDMEENGATDFQIAKYTYERRAGQI